MVTRRRGLVSVMLVRQGQGGGVVLSEVQNADLASGGVGGFCQRFGPGYGEEERRQLELCWAGTSRVGVRWGGGLPVFFGTGLATEYKASTRGVF